MPRARRAALQPWRIRTRATTSLVAIALALTAPGCAGPAATGAQAGPAMVAQTDLAAPGSPALASSPSAPASTPINAAPHTPGDPLESTNRRFFRAQSGIDRGFFGPIARFYKRVVPRFVRSGLRNIIRNLGEPIVFVNDVLQLKPKRAARTLSRFVINSTVGVAGAVDVAKTADLPHRANGFGNTLGRYGVGPGPYLYLPLIGPTTVRDLLGGQADALALPVGVGFPFDRLDYQLSRGVVSTLDQRAEADDDLKALLSGAADPYATLRSVYLQSRAATIAELRGRDVEVDILDDPLLDPAANPDGDAMPGETGEPQSSFSEEPTEPATAPAPDNAPDAAEEVTTDPKSAGTDSPQDTDLTPTAPSDAPDAPLLVWQEAA